MMHDSLALAAFAQMPKVHRNTSWMLGVWASIQLAYHGWRMKSRKNKDHIPNVEVALEIDVPAFRNGW